MVTRMGYGLKVYLKLQLMHIRAQLEYKADFWIGVVGALLYQGAGFVFIWVTLLQMPQIAGWSLWEVAILYTFTIIPRGLVELLCDGQWQLRLLVNRGEFDRLLVRPISPIVQVLTQFSSVHGLGSVALGLALLAHAVSRLNMDISLWQPLFFVAAMLNAVVLIASINLATNTIAFWEPSPNNSFPFMAQSCLDFVKFPISLYDKGLQALLCLLLPFAFVSYFPALVLLGKTAAPVQFACLTMLSGPATMVLAYLCWHQGLRRYQGAGG